MSSSRGSSQGTLRGYTPSTIGSEGDYSDGDRGPDGLHHRRGVPRRILGFATPRSRVPSAISRGGFGLNAVMQLNKFRCLHCGTTRHEPCACIRAKSVPEFHPPCSAAGFDLPTVNRQRTCLQHSHPPTVALLLTSSLHLFPQIPSTSSLPIIPSFHHAHRRNLTLPTVGDTFLSGLLIVMFQCLYREVAQGPPPRTSHEDDPVMKSLTPRQLQLLFGDDTGRTPMSKEYARKHPRGVSSWGQHDYPSWVERPVWGEKYARPVVARLVEHKKWHAAAAEREHNQALALGKLVRAANILLPIRVATLTLSCSHFHKSSIDTNQRGHANAHVVACDESCVCIVIRRRTHSHAPTHPTTQPPTHQRV
jgi:hypothetical protein